MVDIKYGEVNTHNENGDRFVLTFEENGGVWVYDNHLRDGYGLYAGDDSSFTDGKVNKENIEYIIGKLNELYEENKALKNGNKYHQLLMDKFDEEMEEWLWYLENSRGDRSMKRVYWEVIRCLGDIKEVLDGDEYA